MRFLTVLMTAALIATTITAIRRTTVPRIVAVGVLFAVSPMVLFVGSSVNPNGVEIAAAVALWVCGLVLVSQAHETIDNRLVAATGIAGCVLALSRQLGPLWLALIAITIAVFGSSEALRALARSSWARVWAALIVACSVAQIGWNAVVGSLGYTRYPNAPRNIPTADIARFTVGSVFGRYKEMVGTFGWLDTPSPALTYVLWTAGVGFLVLVALAWARRRRVAALLVIIAATVVVPLVLEIRGVRRRRWARVAGPLRDSTGSRRPDRRRHGDRVERTRPPDRRAPAVRRRRRDARRRAHPRVRPEPPALHGRRTTARSSTGGTPNGRHPCCRH